MPRITLDAAARRDAMHGVDLPASPEEWTPDSVKPAYFYALKAPLAIAVERAIRTDLPSARRLDKWHPEASFQKALRSALAVNVETVINDEMSAEEFAALQAAKEANDGLLNLPHEAPAKEARRGAATAAFALTTVYSLQRQNLGEIHTEDDPLAVIRNSHGMLSEHMIKTPLQSMILTQLARKKQLPGVNFEPADMRPGKFEYEFPLKDLPVSSNIRVFDRRLQEMQPLALRVGDVQSPGPVIGCPVMFTPGLVTRLWQWTVDQAQQRPGLAI